MSYWKRYNEKLSSITQVMIDYNKNNKFNAVEQYILYLMYEIF